MCFRIASLAAAVEGEKREYRSLIESVSLRVNKIHSRHSRQYYWLGGSCPDLKCFYKALPRVKKREGSSYTMWSFCKKIICFRIPSWSKAHLFILLWLCMINIFSDACEYVNYNFPHSWSITIHHDSTSNFRNPKPLGFLLSDFLRSLLLSATKRYSFLEPVLQSGLCLLEHTLICYCFFEYQEALSSFAY